MLKSERAVTGRGFGGTYSGSHGGRNGASGTTKMSSASSLKRERWAAAESVKKVLEIGCHRDSLRKSGEVSRRDRIRKRVDARIFLRRSASQEHIISDSRTMIGVEGCAPETMRRAFD